MIRSAGRIPTRVPSLELFAQSLLASEVFALEAASGAEKIVPLLRAHGARVIVASTRKLKAISEAKAKTDRLDARLPARPLLSGLLDDVWTPDERTRALRRLTNRLRRVVRARTRAKNEAHARWRATCASVRRSPTRSARPGDGGSQSSSCR
jgi:transposase